MDARGNLLTPGSEGEIVFRGDAVMEGYLDAEEANREVFLNGWFRTGDLGRMDHEGDLFITGRIKEVINRGGETISPVEIDHALAEHPGIARAASFAVAHPTLGDDIVAAVVLRPGTRAVASEIRNFLAERLSRSKVPGRIWFVESIPLNANGKPLRDTLRTQFQASAQAEASPASRRRILGLAAASGWRGLDASPQFGHARRGRQFLRHGGRFAVGRSPVYSAGVGNADRRSFAGPRRVPRLANLFPTWSRLSPKECIAPKYGLKTSRQSACSRWAMAHRCSSFPRKEWSRGLCVIWPGALGDQQPFYALRHRLTDAADFAGIASRFVTLISRIRPAGEIVLGGHCYGGILAYEVAQRMLAMSRPGISVVLVDVDTPGYRRVRVNLPIALRAVARGQGRKLAAELADHLRFVRDKKRSVNRELPADKSAAPETAPVAETAMPGRLSPGGIVLRTYVPRPFPGPLASALAAGAEVSERILRDSRRGWRELAEGPFQERSLLGSHHSIFDAENAPGLASFIRSALQAPHCGTVSKNACHHRSRRMLETQL